MKPSISYEYLNLGKKSEESVLKRSWQTQDGGLVPKMVWWGGENSKWVLRAGHTSFIHMWMWETGPQAQVNFYGVNIVNSDLQIHIMWRLPWPLSWIKGTQTLNLQDCIVAMRGYIFTFWMYYMYFFKRCWRVVLYYDCCPYKCLVLKV